MTVFLSRKGCGVENREISGTGTIRARVEVAGNSRMETDETSKLSKRLDAARRSGACFAIQVGMRRSERRIPS